MLITKFGSTYAGAFTFSQVNASDQFSLMRPPVVADIDGSAGAYDFLGADNFPIASQPITIEHTLSAASYAAVDTALDALKADTICVGRDKLWGLVRDGSKRWAWAKCIGLSHTEAYRQQHKLMPVSLQFMLQDGLWYGETEQDSGNGPASTFTATNDGNAPAHMRLDFAAYSAPPGSYTIDVSNSTNGTGFSFTGSIAATKHLLIDSAKMTALNDGANAYANLTPDDLTLWLILDPGANTIVYSFNGSSNSVHFYWYDTWL